VQEFNPERWDRPQGLDVLVIERIELYMPRQGDGAPEETVRRPN
jgi:hypothetical protein